VFGAYATLASFSREQEREADAEAADRLAELGYDLASAARLWHAVHEEEKVNPRGLLSAIFATHPATEARLAWLDQRAQRGGPAAPSAGRDRYAAALAPFRRLWLADELGRRNYAQSEVLLARLVRRAGWEADVLYAQGELYRRRAQPGDEERAFAAYQAAAARPEAAAEVQRALGQAHQRRGERDAARAAFRRYLERAPEAADRAMVESYLEALEDGP
jgi:predicted Zn-dependent protease